MSRKVVNGFFSGFSGMASCTSTLAIGALLIIGGGAVFAEEYEFDVDAQRTDGSLMEIAETGEIQVLFAPEPVQKNQSPAVRGKRNVESAINESLAESDLTYEFRSDDFVLVTQVSTEVTTPSTESSSGGSQLLLAQLQDEQARDEIRGTLESGDPETPAEPFDTIVVTGTRLRGVDPASPRIEITRQQIEQGGYTSIEDVVRNLPQNLGSASAVSNQLGQGEFGATRVPSNQTLGSSGVNLRGLGTRSTLILVNGRRKARSSYAVNTRPFQDLLTDTSSIPISQVERIEIITDGASAIYGADAVAGVVNIILRENYDGLSLGLRVEDASNGADRYRLDMGTTLGWDSGFLTLSANLEQTEPNDPNKLIRSGPNGPGDFTAFGGVDRRFYGIGPTGEGSVVSALVTPFGQVFAGPVLDGPNPFYPRDPVTGAVLGPREPGVPSVLVQSDLGPEVERYSLRLNGEQTLADSHTLNFEISYDEQNDENSLNFENIRFAGNPAENTAGTLLVPRVGFPFPQQLNGVRQYVRISAANPSNPYGQDVLVGYDMAAESALVAAQALPISGKLETTSATIGLSGDLPFSDWRYDISGSFSREETETRDYLSDFFDFAGAAAIADQFDPFSGTATQSNADLLTAPIDVFSGDNSNETYQYTAFASGTLFETPAGSAQLAIGFEHRDSSGEGITTGVNFDGSELLDPFSGMPREPFVLGPNDEEVDAFFMELAIPVVKDRPGFKELTISAAARYEDYDRSGFINARNFSAISNVDGIDLATLVGDQAANAAGSAARLQETATYDNTSPSFGLNWRLNETLVFKATWGESFLPPLAAQLFGNVDIRDLSFFPNAPGPFISSGGVTYTGIFSLDGANPNLQPQTAETTTLTLEWSPSWVSGLDLGVTWSDISYDNFIASPVFALNESDLVANFEILPQIFILGDTTSLVYDTRELNLSSNVSETVDFRVNYQFDSGIGSWLVDLNATRTFKTERQLVPFIPAIDISDTERGPSEWAANLRVAWARGDWNATWETYFVSETRMLEPFSAVSFFGAQFRDTDELPINQNPQMHVASYTRSDVQVGWSSLAESGWTSGLRVAIGLQNVFEPDPPFVDNFSGFAANRVFTSGRVIYLNLNKDVEF